LLLFVCFLLNLIPHNGFISKKTNLEILHRLINLVQVTKDQRDRLIAVPFAGILIKDQGHSHHILNAEGSLSPVSVIIYHSKQFYVVLRLSQRTHRIVSEQFS